MSAVDVANTIRTLATIVRLHEGNRDAAVNALLDRADSCCAAVAELINAAKEVVDNEDEPRFIYGSINSLRAALARVGGAA